MFICKNCNSEVYNKTGIFCSQSCAAKFNNKKRIFTPKLDKRTKTISCNKCLNKFEVNIRAKQSLTCIQCQKNKICKVCGCEKCQRPDICSKYRLFDSLHIYFGFDIKKIGSVAIYEEFEKIRNLITEDYLEKELSTLKLQNKYKHLNNGNFLKILKCLDVPILNIKEGIKRSILNGAMTPNTCPTFNTGKHISWEGKCFFYRSNYELNYAKEMDAKRISYEVEYLRILYWDSQLCKQRIAIPDFFLPASNRIIEIKSSYTYNKKNMIDKFDAYKKHGYDCLLILDGKEYFLLNETEQSDKILGYKH